MSSSTGTNTGVVGLEWHHNPAEGHYTNGAHHRYHVIKQHRRSWTVTVYALNRHIGVATRGHVVHTPSPFGSLSAAKTWVEQYEATRGRYSPTRSSRR